jgi:hypothetical protein
MSKRAPNRDVVLVRRATCPSTTSSRAATAASATRVGREVPPVNASATIAATPPVSARRTRVTESAGPQLCTPDRRRPWPSAGQASTPKVTPTTQPAPPSPTVAARVTMTADWASAPSAAGWVCRVISRRARSVIESSW